MRQIAKSARLHWKFYQEFLNNRYFNLGIGGATAAYVLRAVASGMFIPFSLQEITNGLFNRSVGSMSQGLWLLALAGLIYAITEWLFRPFWIGIAQSIRLIKMRLVKGVAGGAARDNGDDIGKLVNDVDFVMWNVGGIINSMVPNLFTAAVAEVTIFEMSPILGLVGLIGLPFYVALLEHYVKNVEEARGLERRAYSESIHAASEYLAGRAGVDAFTSAMDRWIRGISRNIHLDREYWSSSFAVGYAVPLITALIGVNYVNEGRLSVGSLVGTLTASLTMYTALVNAFWGICLLGQNTVAISRIFSIREASARRTLAPVQAAP